MIEQVKKFYSLSWQDQWLFLEAFCLTGVVRLAILLLPFRWLAPVLGNYTQESPMAEADEDMIIAKKISRIIVTVSRCTPWESKCLVQAIVGKFMLRQHGVANTLYLGVGKDENKGLVAHAWLRCGELIVTGGYGWNNYAIVGRFGDFGDGYGELLNGRRC